MTMGDSSGNNYRNNRPSLLGGYHRDSQQQQRSGPSSGHRPPSQQHPQNSGGYYRERMAAVPPLSLSRNQDHDYSSARGSRTSKEDGGGGGASYGNRGSQSAPVSAYPHERSADQGSRFPYSQPMSPSYSSSSKRGSNAYHSTSNNNNNNSGNYSNTSRYGGYDQRRSMGQGTAADYNRRMSPLSPTRRPRMMGSNNHSHHHSSSHHYHHHQQQQQQQQSKAQSPSAAPHTPSSYRPDNWDQRRRHSLPVHNHSSEKSSALWGRQGYGPPPPASASRMNVRPYGGWNDRRPIIREREREEEEMEEVDEMEDARNSRDVARRFSGMSSASKRRHSPDGEGEDTNMTGGPVQESNHPPPQDADDERDEALEASDEDEDEDEEVEEEEDEVDQEEQQLKDELMEKMDKLDDNIEKLEEVLELLKHRAEVKASESQPSTRPSSPITSPTEEMLQPSPPPPSKPTKLSKKQQQALQSKKKKQTSRPERAFTENLQDQLIARIYKENQARAKKAHNEMGNQLRFEERNEGSYSPNYVFHQPAFQQLMEKHERMRPVLQKFFQLRTEMIQDKIQSLRDEYEDAYERWILLTAKYEKNQRKRILKAVKYGIVPARNSSRTKDSGPYSSQTSLDYALHYLQIQDDDYRYVKTLAVVPAMILDQKMREEVRFVDNNRLFEDSIHTIRQRNHLNPWTEDEKKIFAQQYLEYPKEFGQIAKFLPNKTTQDCVLYYYLNKKSLKLKNLTKQALALRSKRRKKLAAFTDNYEDHQMSQHYHDSRQPFEEQKERKPKERNRRNQEDKAQSSSNEIPDEESSWSKQELEKAKAAFIKYGKNFHLVAQDVETKTILQCRRLYVEYKRRHRINLTVDPTLSTASITTVDEKPPNKKKQKANKSTDDAGTKKEKEPKDKEGKTKSVSIESPVTAVDETARPGSPVHENATGDTNKKEKRRTVSYWTAKEKSDFLKYFMQFGRDWRALSQHIVTKSEVQIRNYYQNHKQSLGLSDDEGLTKQAQGTESESESKRPNDQKPPILAYPNMFPYPVPYPTAPPPGSMATAQPPTTYTMYPTSIPIPISMTGTAPQRAFLPPPGMALALPPGAPPGVRPLMPQLASMPPPILQHVPLGAPGYTLPAIPSQPMMGDPAGPPATGLTPILPAPTPAIVPLPAPVEASPPEEEGNKNEGGTKEEVDTAVDAASNELPLPSPLPPPETTEPEAESKVEEPPAQTE